MSQVALPLELHRRGVGDSELILVAGDLLSLHAQGVVCYSSTLLKLHSAVAVRIVQQGGPVVRADAAKHVPARIGDALALSAGQLPMRYVLVAITNELRTQPTLDTVRAALRVALGRAAALDLDSLALPLLHVRRRLDDNDLLVVTLAALIDHLSVPTTLRRVLLLVNEEEKLARPVVQRVVPLLDVLARVGGLRAQVQVLREGDTLTEHLSAPRREALAHELLVQRYQTLAQIVRLLEPLTQYSDVPGRLGLRTELQYCQAEINQVRAELNITREREISG